VRYSSIFKKIYIENAHHQHFVAAYQTLVDAGVKIYSMQAIVIFKKKGRDPFLAKRSIKLLLVFKLPQR
jgi:hypothetical protein